MPTELALFITGLCGGAALGLLAVLTAGLCRAAAAQTRMEAAHAFDRHAAQALDITRPNGDVWVFWEADLHA